MRRAVSRARRRPDVAEVIAGMTMGDRRSYLRQEPDWVPNYGQDGSFAVVDLLRVADVVATMP